MPGREKRKRSRKHRARRPGVVVASTEEVTASKSKDDLAREELAPLDEGERPLAVTIGALISGALALTTIVLFAFGVDTGDADFSAAGTLIYAGLMFLMAWGMWNARYWAVLGFEALLAILIVIWSLLLVRAENVLTVLISLAVIGIGGTLFWFLVKSLARIQMPSGRG
jgi:hypothetical protein